MLHPVSSIECSFKNWTVYREELFADSEKSVVAGGLEKTTRIPLTVSLLWVVCFLFVCFALVSPT